MSSVISGRLSVPTPAIVGSPLKTTGPWGVGLVERDEEAEVELELELEDVVFGVAKISVLELFLYLTFFLASFPCFKEVSTYALVQAGRYRRAQKTLPRKKIR